MSEELKIGIEETKEFIKALAATNMHLLRVLHDGFQMKDAVDLSVNVLRDKEYQKSLVDAIKGVTKIPGEIKDLDPSEMAEIVNEVIQGIIVAVQEYATFRANREAAVAQRKKEEEDMAKKVASGRN